MGYKDILTLKEKDNRDFLLFIILLIVGSLLVQLEYQSSLWWRGAEILSHTTNTLLVYFAFSFFLRDKMKKFSYFIVPLCFILSWPLNFFLMQTIIGDWIWIILTVFTLFYWIFMTAAFATNDIYNTAVKWDEKIGKGTKSLKSIVRGVLFFGGTAISIVILYVATTFILDYQHHSLGFKSIILSINFFMILYIVLFFVIGIIALFFHKSYLWFGMHFLFITFYAIKLMIDLGKYEYATGGGGGGGGIEALEIFSFFFSIYLLLATFGNLMGKKSEVLASKLRIIKPRTLAIWLIYALGLTLNAPALVGDLELWVLGYAYPFFIGIFGFYAIYVYNKKSKLTKEPEEIVRAPKAEKPKIETKQKKIPKEEKKRKKIRKELDKKLNFANYLIKQEKIGKAFDNLKEIKEEAEKYDFYDLILKIEEQINYCQTELSKE